jgi:hypothetical protein
MPNLKHKRKTLPEVTADLVASSVATMIGGMLMEIAVGISITRSRNALG